MKITKKSQIVKLWLNKQTIRDKNLNPADLNTFAALALLRHTISVFTPDGYIEFLPWSSSINAQHTVNATLEDIPDMSKQTIYNCLYKLNGYGYIEYASGRNIKGSDGSRWARYKILKGLTNMEDWNMSDLAPYSPTESRSDEDFLKKNDGQQSETDFEQNFTKSVKKHLAPYSPTLPTVSEEKNENYLDSNKEIKKEKEKEKDIERENEKEPDVPAADNSAKTYEQQTDNNQTANDMEASEAASSNNVTTDVKTSICVDSGEPTKTISKDELNRAAIIYAVLRRAGWRSCKQWDDDVQEFRRQYNAVYSNGEQWTERVIDKLNTIANTSVKNKYTDEYAQRVFSDKQAKALDNIERMFTERKLQRRMMNQKDNDYYQRISWPLGDCLQQLILCAITNRLTAAVWGLRDEYLTA